MENEDMLKQAANSGDISMLYQAIQQNPHVLEEVDAIPFVDTPLHSAASAGHIEFCIEIMRLKPSFSLKLNKEGFSPVHVALQNNHHNLVRCLVENNEELVRVKGKEGFTPLHFLCQSNSDDENIQLLIDFLEICPNSIKDVNVRRESALHIALRHGNLRAFQAMFVWLKENTRNDAEFLERSLLRWTDIAGDSLFHHATLNGNRQAIDLLTKSTRKCMNMRNLEGKTALDLAEAFPGIKITLLKAGAKHGASIPDLNLEKKMRLNTTFLEKALTFIGRMRSSISVEERSVYMVIAALIITAIYQTVLSPPGGLHQADNTNHHVNATSSSSLNFVHPLLVGNKEGASVLPGDVFGIIALANTAIFMGTFTTVLVITPGGRINHFLSLPIYLFTFTYLFSLLIISPPKVPPLLIFFCLPIVCFLPFAIPLLEIVLLKKKRNTYKLP